jgi:hypothetical protein
VCFGNSDVDWNSGDCSEAQHAHSASQSNAKRNLGKCRHAVNKKIDFDLVFDLTNKQTKKRYMDEESAPEEN